MYTSPAAASADRVLLRVIKSLSVDCDILCLQVPKSPIVVCWNGDEHVYDMRQCEEVKCMQNGCTYATINISYNFRNQPFMYNHDAPNIMHHP